MGTDLASAMTLDCGDASAFSASVHCTYASVPCLTFKARPGLTRHHIAATTADRCSLQRCKLHQCCNSFSLPCQTAPTNAQSMVEQGQHASLIPALDWSLPVRKGTVWKDHVVSWPCTDLNVSVVEIPAQDKGHLVRSEVPQCDLVAVVLLSPFIAIPKNSCLPILMTAALMEGW